MRIALVEDNPDHAAQMSRPLQAAGHGCRHFTTASAFLQALSLDTFDAAILDWGLPDMAGIDLLEIVRSRHMMLPLLFVSCRDAEEDMVEALTRGADDFIVKPPRQAELIARLDALTRRKTQYFCAGRIAAQPYVFDLATRQATIHGEAVELTPRLFHLATVFFGKAGILLSRAYLMETVWGQDAAIKTRTLDFHVSQLRNALRLPDHNWRISSIYAHGYRLEALAAAPAVAREPSRPPRRLASPAEPDLLTA